MAVYISESFATAVEKITCDFCSRSVGYYDRLTDSRLACLSCSYAEGLKAAEDCMFHPKEFDPSDTELRIEMIRICQTDIERADKNVCMTEIVIPDDLLVPLKRLTAMHASTVNAEVVAAIGWYTTMCLNKNLQAMMPADPTSTTIQTEKLDLIDQPLSDG